MPNIKSAIKRVKVTEKKNDENKAVKSKLLTYTKKVKGAVEAGNMEEAKKLYNETVSLIDKAAADNVIHKNCANRRKASLAKLLENK